MNAKNQIDEAALRTEFSRRPELQEEFSSADAYVSYARSEAERKARQFAGDIEAEQREEIDQLQKENKHLSEKIQIRTWAAKTDTGLKQIFASTQAVRDEFNSVESFLAFVKHERMRLNI